MHTSGRSTRVSSELRQGTATHRSLTHSQTQSSYHHRSRMIWTLGLSAVTGAIAFKLYQHFNNSGVNYTKFKLQEYQMPIFYGSSYNMGFYGLEAAAGATHSFDLAKYQKVFNRLTATSAFASPHFVNPPRASDEDLLAVHTAEYLNSLQDSKVVARIGEVPVLQSFPSFILNWLILNPMRHAVGGTVLGAKAALERGWAINLGGGFHHASHNKGGGFCYYADITLAIRALQTHSNIQRVMVVDLDAHQGNGHERDSVDQIVKNVYIMDAYNQYIYPADDYAKKGINKAVELGSFETDSSYLSRVSTAYREALDEFSPEFIIYNAGTDILENDRLGRLSVTPEGVIKRDELVFSEALSRKIPILMVLSGGYQQNNGGVIADSIINLNNKFKLTTTRK